MGHAARALLQAPSYVAAVQHLEVYHTSAMLSAPEGSRGVDAREHHHRMLCALREIHGELAARALAADEIERRLAEQADDPEDEIL